MDPNNLPEVSFSSFVDNILGILGLLSVVLIGVSVVIFIIGVLKTMARAGDSAERQKGKQRIVWGLIGIFVAVNIWGLVNFVLVSLWG